MSNTAEIKVFDLDVLERKVKELNKKAAKAGVKATTWRLLETVTKKGKKYDAWTGEAKPYEVFDFYLVELVFDEVVLPGGWRLVGVIDHTENLVRSVPDVEQVDLRPFVERGAVCDHCHTYRDRNETFILDRGAGSAKVQVGRQCLGLFLGIDPERALSLAGMVGSAMVFDEEWTGTPKTKGVELSFFLAHAACMIREAGWRSRTSAKESYGQTTATADMALTNMDNQFLKLKDKRSGKPLWSDPSEADSKLADEVEAWMEGLAHRSNLSDYMANLAQIGQNGFCTASSAGFAASAINAYHKEKEQEIKRAEAVHSSGIGAEWVGTVGERLTVKASKVSSAGFDTEWGYTLIHKFVAEGGAVLSWRTQTELDNGQYMLTGTVKKHGEFRGERQTEVTRCKVGLVK